MACSSVSHMKSTALPPPLSRGSQSGSDHEASDGTPSPVTKKKRVYRYDRGFCYIPKRDWQKGLEKRAGQMPFAVSSLQHAVIIPAGYDYPHVTLDVQETRFLGKPKEGGEELVAVRISQAHYTPAKRSRRIAFEIQGQDVVYEDSVPKPVRDRIRGYFARTHFPFYLPALSGEPAPVQSLAGSVENSPVLSKPVQERSGATVEPNATLSLERVEAESSLAEALAEEETSLSNLSLDQESSPASATPSPVSRRAGGQARKGKHRGKSRSAKPGVGQKPSSPAPKAAKPAKAEPVDTYQDWCDDLDVDNLLEALDTLDFDSVDDRSLRCAVIYWNLLQDNMLARVLQYGDKICARSKAIMVALEQSASLIHKSSVATHGRRRYREAAVRKTNKEVSRARQVGEQSEQPLYQQQALDFALNTLLPSDFIDPKRKPNTSDANKFAGYRIALLLAFKEYVEQCHDLRCQEYFGRAYYLAIHIKMIMHSQAPGLIPMLEKLKLYLDAIRADLNGMVESFRPETYTKGEDLAQLHNNFAQMREWNDVGVGCFSGYATLLGDLSEALSQLTPRQWQRVAQEFVAPLSVVETLESNNPEHWQKLTHALETMLAITKTLSTP